MTRPHENEEAAPAESRAPAVEEGAPALLPGREREGGFSILEMSIAMVITVMLLQVSVSSTLVLNQSTHLGNKRVHLMTKAEYLLQKIAYEVRRSSDDTDPETNDPYLSISGDAGERSLRFRRVVEYGEEFGELVTVWSTEITIELDGTDVVRTQDGEELVLMRNVSFLDFEMNELGAVETEVSVFDLSPQSAEQVVTRAVSIVPEF